MNGEPDAQPDFRALFEAAPGRFLVLRPDLTIAAVTDGYLEATMTDRGTIVGHGIFEVFPDNPDDPTARGVGNLRASLERVSTDLVADTMAVQRYDIRRPQAEGGGFEERFWSPVNSPVVGPDGRLRYIIHRVEDVTEFVRLRDGRVEQERHTEALRGRAAAMEAEVFLRAQEVAATNRQLQQANIELSRLYEKTRELDELKTAFFANVSHELRTPLTLILAPADRILASLAPADPLRAGVATIARNARLLLKHVTDLLDLASIEAGRVDLRTRHADLAAVVRLVAGNFESLADERGMSYRVMADEVLETDFDPDRIERVLINLLGNAFKFTPSGGTIRCAVTRDRSADLARIEIADSGPGIPALAREAVFERFRQVESGADRRYGGTGLGLAIAREIAELHGGRVEVRDAPEGGALFVLELPLRAEALREESVPRASSAAAAEASMLAAGPQRLSDGGVDSSLDRPTVLIVDDHLEMRDLLRSSLEDLYRVISVPDGREALLRAREVAPDAVVTDMMMPGFTGSALLAELRDDPAFDDIPVMVLTAKTDELVRIEALRTGANDFLTKPFSVDELRARIANLVRMRRSLAGRAARLGSIIAQSPISTVVVRSDGRVELASRTALELLGVSEDELVGMPLPARALAPEVVEALDNPATDELRGHEMVVRRADGTEVPVELYSAPLRGIEHEPAVVLRWVDLSERRRFEAQLRQAQRLESIGRLTGGIAHDFNNVLTAVLGFTDLISAAATLEDVGELAEHVRMAAQRAADLVGKLMAFARQQVLEFRPVDVAKVVEAIRPMLERLIGEDVVFDVRVDAEQWVIEADRGQLEQVLVNLVVNARDAMPTGGSLTIEVRNVELDGGYAAEHPEVTPGPHVMLAVSDTGSGMDPATVARVFEPFFTTKEVGEGTGLGLATVYGVVKQTGGHIWVYSELGRGTTFRLYFPRAAGAADEPASEVARPVGGSETLLVVEDDEGVRALAATVLARLGYRTLVAPDAASALAIVETEPIDLLVTDVVMPVMSGPELVARLRASKPGLRVLFMSGYTAGALVHHGRVAEGDAFIQKPFTPAALAERVRAALGAVRPPADRSP